MVEWQDIRDVAKIIYEKSLMNYAYRIACLAGTLHLCSCVFFIHYDQPQYCNVLLGVVGTCVTIETISW